MFASSWAAPCPAHLCHVYMSAYYLCSHHRHSFHSCSAEHTIKHSSCKKHTHKQRKLVFNLEDKKKEITIYLSLGSATSVFWQLQGYAPGCAPCESINEGYRRFDARKYLKPLTRSTKWSVHTNINPSKKKHVQMLLFVLDFTIPKKEETGFAFSSCVLLSAPHDGKL